MIYDLRATVYTTVMMDGDAWFSVTVLEHPIVVSVLLVVYS